MLSLFTRNCPSCLTLLNSQHQHPSRQGTSSQYQNSYLDLAVWYCSVVFVNSIKISANTETAMLSTSNPSTVNQHQHPISPPASTHLVGISFSWSCLTAPDSRTCAPLSILCVLHVPSLYCVRPCLYSVCSMNTVHARAASKCALTATFLPPLARILDGRTPQKFTFKLSIDKRIRFLKQFPFS